MSEWQEYQPDREREKDWYDIQLRNGDIVDCCYPNGDHWYPSIGKPIADYRVVKIRPCEHPFVIPEQDDELSENTP